MAVGLKLGSAARRSTQRNGFYAMASARDPGTHGSENTRGMPLFTNCIRRKLIYGLETRSCTKLLESKRSVWKVHDLCTEQQEGMQPSRVFVQFQVLFFTLVQNYIHVSFFNSTKIMCTLCAEIQWFHRLGPLLATATFKLAMPDNLLPLQRGEENDSVFGKAVQISQHNRLRLLTNSFSFAAILPMPQNGSLPEPPEQLTSYIT